jgi:hypothetical protein
MLAEDMNYEEVYALALTGDQYASDALEYLRTRPTKGIEPHIVPVIEWIALAAASGLIGGFASDGIKAVRRRFSRRERRTGATVNRPLTGADIRILSRAVAIDWHNAGTTKPNDFGSLRVKINDADDGLVIVTVVDATGRRLVVRIEHELGDSSLVEVEVREDS